MAGIRLRGVGAALIRLLDRLSPPKAAWRGAALGLVATWVVWAVAYVIIEPAPRFSLTEIAGGVAFLVWMGFLSLALIVATELIVAPPRRFRLALCLALPPTFVSLMMVWGDAGGAVASAVTLGLAALVAGAAAALRRAPRQGGKVARVALGIGAVGVAAVSLALLWPPAKEVAQPALEAAGPQLALPDPGAAGPYGVETFTYGSGHDRRRPEYAAAVRFRTQPVNASRLDRNWKGLAGWFRTAYWGFDPHRYPLNGRVWAPVGPGPFPIALIVHGNHAMEKASDGGYAYLGQLLASQGVIAVSVDENFINSSNADAVFLPEMRSGEENDARAWMLLQHLSQWRRWSADPRHPLYRKADLERVALIGHSRGGEAVSTATAFNRLAAYPDDAGLPFNFGFGIRAVAAIAPVDGQYKPRGAPTPLQDVDYFVIHGGLDGDVQSFLGQSQYQRVTFTPGFNGFKAAVWLRDANHGQFNTAWGRNDMGSAIDFLLDERPILAPEAQRQVMRAYLGAFLKASLAGETGYRALFADPRSGAAWLPRVVLTSSYRDAGLSPLATYEEDLDPTSGADGTVRIAVRNLSLARETWAKLKQRDLSTHVAVLTWDDRFARRDRSYGFDFAQPRSLPRDGALVFSASATRDSTLPEDFEPPKTKAPPADPGRPLDWTVTLVDADGREARAPLSTDAPLYPPFTGLTRRARWIDFDATSEIVLQRFRLPFSVFAAANPALDLARIRAVRFDFDRSPRGAIALDDVGVSPGL